MGRGLGGEGKGHQFRWVKNENTMEHNGCYYIGMSVQAVSFKQRTIETIRDLGRFRKESLVLYVYVCVCVYGIVISKLLVFLSVSNSMDGSAIPIFINPISFVVITC